MKVGIAGIGGIGSNVARLLAQAGVKRIKIVDFDCVESSNLNRQFYQYSQVGEKKTDSLEINLKEISPEMVIEKKDHRIQVGDSKALFSDCPVVVEGFDDKRLKKMMIEELAGQNKIVVSASGIAGREMAHVAAKKMAHCYIVGDFVSDQDEHALFPPKIAMVASMMAGIVLDQMLKQDAETRYNKMLANNN